jgi:uncharacterized protein
MTSSIEPYLPEAAGTFAASTRRHLLIELLADRKAVEEQFAREGHTHRHGRLYRQFEHRVTRPALRTALKLSGLYPRGLQNALSPIVKQIPLTFADLPDGLDGFQILHLSDFHIEGTPGLADALCEILCELKADVCVMTGDYRFEDYGPCEPIYPLMRQIVASLQTRLGVFGILGNHDHSEIAFRLEEMGIRMLVNESVPVGEPGGPLWLIGVDDPFDYQCHDLQKAMASVPPDSFRVLLAHAPEIYEEANREGIHLYLSGHTHGGQIRLPGIGAVRRNANCPAPLVYGHWHYKGVQGYTSAGVGCSSLPVRYGCPPEIVLIELQSAKSETGS